MVRPLHHDYQLTSNFPLAESFQVFTCKIWNDCITRQLNLDCGCIVFIATILSYEIDTFNGLNTLRPRQEGRHRPDDIFKCFFLNENVSIAIKILLKFVSKCPINNILASVQIMARRRPGNKPLSEPMTVSLPTHICVTRPQWVNVHVVQ